MDDKTRRELKNQLQTLGANNAGFRGLMGLPPTPIVGGVPPVPIPTDLALNPYLHGLRQHADDFDRLLKLLETVVDQI
ncbi:MAG TPA: hypothetical protein VLD58_15300 [Gemmatimonadales bacterium]|nr:hypothetical protein [Gemmatimonadales bacterium]